MLILCTENKTHLYTAPKGRAVERVLGFMWAPVGGLAYKCQAEGSGHREVTYGVGHVQGADCLWASSPLLVQGGTPCP